MIVRYVTYLYKCTCVSFYEHEPYIVYKCDWMRAETNQNYDYTLRAYVYKEWVSVCVSADMHSTYVRYNVLYVCTLNTSLDTLSSKINDESGTLSIIER